MGSIALDSPVLQQLSMQPTITGSNIDSDPPTIRFTTVRDLFDKIHSIPGDFLVVESVSPSNFRAIERERAKQGHRLRFRRYNSTSRILIIIIPTRPHEALHLRLNNAFYKKLVQRNMDNCWETSGATRHRPPGHPGGDGGEGDSTGGPDPERLGPGKWPTLVIEAGFSESLGELHNDMRWWFRASNHDVKIVVLAKLDGPRRQILIEKWEEDFAQPRGAVTRTRAVTILQNNGTLEPVRRQSITIARDETTNPVSYNVTRGALVLGFRLLFLRAPGPQDEDFIISVQELQLYAEKVWAVVP